MGTHLSREELTTARKKIIGCGAAEFDRAGRDGVWHFLINKVVLVDLLRGPAETRRLLAVVETHRSTLEKISVANYSRAVKLERKAEKFSYVDVYVRERGVCYLCGEEITKGPGQRGEHLQFDHVIA